MPKFFCDYCDVYLTHDSISVRKAHNSGRNHLRNVVEYYQQIGHEKAQSVIDSITSSYAAEGQPMPGMGGPGGYPPPLPFMAPPGPGQPFQPPPLHFGGQPPMPVPGMLPFPPPAGAPPGFGQGMPPGPPMLPLQPGYAMPPPGAFGPPPGGMPPLPGMLPPPGAFQMPPGGGPPLPGYPPTGNN